LPKKIKLGLELYMEGRVSLGKAAEIAGLPVTEFDSIRAKAKVPIRGPDD
jgi:predicted HTH domain antitoxin